ncbi:peptidase S24 [Cellulophaga sp. E16_2]|uniref:SOS-response transcriptional repressors (RecA-mediatedautopeptidase)-like protein n=1 Tax=Cellulophaga algicola (strain DSM 14237 / IC166 / ACAM 630) TaxID=688270 RepID=E6X6U2_CELAD|nr:MULTISPECIES: S24 family peptidase [Cellulophaga]ADV50655.1 SOS-response transcriptional repressors (RecA-mediatedautopeptidase)-like protein [Cellulophaga algicola DSM 14237]MBO0593039.1 peptidase S24 [Cellulophaga sp. E16_2]
MELFSHGKIKKAEKRHAPEVSKQTGFPSPATHYLEPSINLEQELISNGDATFYVRIDSDELADFAIYKHDVLIIDRSFYPKENNLALVIVEGQFKVIRIPPKQTQEEFTLWGVITYIIHSCK